MCTNEFDFQTIYFHNPEVIKPINKQVTKEMERVQDRDKKPKKRETVWYRLHLGNSKIS